MLGAPPALGQAPPSAFTIIISGSATAQDIVDLADEYPDKYLAIGGSPLLPVGHPSVSNADCVATPNSTGCRIAAARALAASQSVVMDKLCISARIDIVRKYPGYELDVINGVPFDENWLLEGPSSAHDSRLALWRNGVSILYYLDPSFFHDHEALCCHDENVACGPADQCAVQYGAGDDVTQQFKTNSVAVDMRIPAYQQWAAERVVAQILDQGADCIGIVYKSGIWSYYGGPDSGRDCWEPDGNAVEGPTRNYDPCAKIGGALEPTPYGAGEYEAGLNEAFRNIFTEMDLAGLPNAAVTSIDRPPALSSTWSWMEPDVRANPHMVGEQKSFNPNPPDPDPPPSVGAYLLPPSPDGNIPHLVDVGADTRGSAEGPIDYHFWCHCTSSTKDLATALAVCGTDPGNYVPVLASNDDPILVPDACYYDTPDTYIVKILVEREGVAGQDQNAVNADPGPLQTSFEDETFSNINWSHAVLVDTAGGADTTTASIQTPSGGNPDEYQAGDHIWDAAGTVVEGHLIVGPSYDPGVQGPLGTIDATLDASVLSGSMSLDVGVLILQSGSHYSASLGTVTPGGWQSFSALGLVASDFVLVGGAGSPDFSKDGGPLAFGYVMSGDAASAGSSQWGIDNFSLQVIPPPPPPSLPSLGPRGVALLIAGLALIAIAALGRAPSARRSSTEHSLH